MLERIPNAAAGLMLIQKQFSSNKPPSIHKHGVITHEKALCAKLLISENLYNIHTNERGEGAREGQITADLNMHDSCANKGKIHFC